MKVYIAIPNEPYSGGCILIAAESFEQAQDIAKYEMLHSDCGAVVSESSDLQTTRTESGVIINVTYFE